MPSALLHLTAGVALKAVINGFLRIHKADLHDNAAVYIAVGVADLPQI